MAATTGHRFTRWRKAAGPRVGPTLANGLNFLSAANNCVYSLLTTTSPPPRRAVVFAFPFLCRRPSVYCNNYFIVFSPLRSTHTHTHTHTHARTQTHARTYTNTRTHIHTYTWSFFFTHYCVMLYLLFFVGIFWSFRKYFDFYWGFHVT